MIFSRNLIKLVNISGSHQVKCLNRPANWRSLQTSSWLSQQIKDQAVKNDETEGIKIYYGTLTPNIKSVKFFSLSTSIAGIIAQPILYDQATQVGSSTGLILATCSIVGFFTFVTPFLLHIVTKRYVTEMHYNEATNEYIATVLNFFLMKKKVKFQVTDVHVPEVPGMLTSFFINNKDNKKTVLFVDPKLFEDPNHYVKIMGYDKPMDFKLNLESKADEEKK